MTPLLQYNRPLTLPHFRQEGGQNTQSIVPHFNAGRSSQAMGFLQQARWGFQRLPVDLTVSEGCLVADPPCKVFNTRATKSTPSQLAPDLLNLVEAQTSTSTLHLTPSNTTSRIGIQSCTDRSEREDSVEYVRRNLGRKCHFVRSTRAIFRVSNLRIRVCLHETKS